MRYTRIRDKSLYYLYIGGEHRNRRCEFWEICFTCAAHYDWWTVPCFKCKYERIPNYSRLQEDLYFGLCVNCGCIFPSDKRLRQLRCLPCQELFIGGTSNYKPIRIAMRRK